MIPIIEDAILGTDLNGDFHDLLNVNALDPVPSNLATIDHPGLSDSRPPVPGSVTDASVSPTAGIVQSKLSLNGVIPPLWLGTASTQAAPGDQAEYVSRKNQPGGYAGLDGSGKVPSSVLPGTTGTGTVTSVDLTMPAGFVVSGAPITSAGTINIGWVSVTDKSWFGRSAGSTGPPQFYSTPLPTSLIPNLDASIVTSGIFGAARLPVAVGLGTSHAPGAVPDPGDGTGGALASDYLARDMSFKPAPILSLPYQPVVPNPTFGVSLSAINPVPVAILCSLPGATIFYSLTSALTGFVELAPGQNVSVTSPGTVWAYAASLGYNNSAVVSQVV